MKKNLFITVMLIAVMALSVLSFAACAPIESSEKDSELTPPTSEPPAAEMVTVSFWDGTEELKVETIEKGATVAEWTPEKVGYSFMGWFAEASLAQAFDFTAPVNEDIDVFAAWRSNDYVEDTAAWYFIGAGAGDMSASNWGHSTEGLFMVKDDTITDANVYTITILMYAGDKFQITHSDSWDYQQGIGHMVGFEYAAGVNPYAPASGEMTAADKKYGEVRDAEGTLIFYGGDEYDKSAEVWNVWLAEGQDGVYKFTFTTYPQNPAYNTIEWELVEKKDPLTSTHEMAFIGTMNGWSTDATVLADWMLNKSDDGSYWTGIINITEDMYADWATDADGNMYAALKIYNIVNGGYYSDTGDNILLRAGSYAFKYTVEGDKVEYSALGWYVVGTFVDAEGNAVNFAVKEGTTPALTVEGGVATATVTIEDVSGRSDYSWITSQGKTDANGNPAGAAIKVVYGSELAIDGWYGDGNDNYYLAAGTYTISIDLETKAITIVAA